MAISKRDLYRYPWSGNDNPIGWLELTDKCNIYCEGCYRINNMDGHKSLEQLKEEVDLLHKWRNCDNISLAGGEPLIHPNILELVSYIHEKGMKPLILTNGVKLVDNRPFLEELKQAGAIGFTFHIDSFQHRPHWKGKSEQELFELRLYFAKLVKEVGGLYNSFGMTVYPGNMDFVPEMVKWANKHIDLVHGLVFITFRCAGLDGSFEYYVDGEKIEPKVTYTRESDDDAHITSVDVYNKLKEHFPHYEAGAYMGGTQTHDKFTWVAGAQLGSKDKMYGSVGAKVMELAQVYHHLRHGTYLVYSPSNTLPKIGFLLGLLDKEVRKAGAKFWKTVLTNPTNLFKPIYIQTIGIIQAPDQLEDGRIDMCESCPDMTVWDGKLVHSCRMDEWRLYGNYVTAQPTQKPAETGGTNGHEQELIQPTEIAVAEETPVTGD